MDYEAGIVRLSSSDGMLLEIPEFKLSGVDRNYIRSQDACRRAQRKVIPYLFGVLFRSLIKLEQTPWDGMGLPVTRIDFSHYLTGPGEPADTERLGFFGKLLALIGLRRNKQPMYRL